MAECKSCAAPCRWAKSKSTGKFMLLDREPVPGGNITLVPRTNYADGIPRAVVHGRPEDIEGPLQLDFEGNAKPLAYQDHHTRCQRTICGKELRGGNY